MRVASFTGAAEAGQRGKVGSTGDGRVAAVVARKVVDVRLRGQPIEVAADRLAGGVREVELHEVRGGKAGHVGNLEDARGAVGADLDRGSLRKTSRPYRGRRPWP